MTHLFVAIVAAAGVSLVVNAPVSMGDTPIPPVSMGDTPIPPVSMGDTPIPPVSMGDTPLAEWWPGGTASPAQSPTPAPAPAAISSEVMILHATNDNSGIDPNIGNIPALSKPPFSSYNSYKLLDRTTMPLTRGVAAPLKLPTGRELRLVYKDVIQPQKQGDPPRYVITATIEAATGKSFLPLVEVNAKPGEVFWVGGQEYKGGSLFIGIKVTP